MSEWRVPLCDLNYGTDEEAAVMRVLRSGWLSMGPEVQAFESEFAQYVGVKHALAVGSGTAALHLAYLALGLGAGDDVIQPAINFVAAANMTVAVGARPQFADICGLAEPTIDPADIRRKITPQTRAVIVMHYGGYLCRMAEIRTICREHGLALIEDACHAVGGCYCPDKLSPESNGKVGALGDLACFSFFSNKNLATGEGGMVTTDRDDLAARLRLLRSHGMTTLTWDRHRGHASSYDVTTHGFNYRLDEIHAALGRSQLARLDEANERRKTAVAIYRGRLTTMSGWIVPFSHDDEGSAYHLMVTLAPDSETRRHATEVLRSKGVQTSLHYPYIPDFKVFNNGTMHDLTKSREFAARAITLPLFPTITMEQIDLVVGTMATAPCAPQHEVAVCES